MAEESIYLRRPDGWSARYATVEEAVAQAVADVDRGLEAGQVTLEVVGTGELVSELLPTDAVTRVHAAHVAAADDEKATVEAAAEETKTAVLETVAAEAAAVAKAPVEVVAEAEVL